MKTGGVRLLVKHMFTLGMENLRSLDASEDGQEQQRGKSQNSLAHGTLKRKFNSVGSLACASGCIGLN